MPKRAAQGELIDVVEFASRISVSVPTARNMAKSRVLCEKGISMNINLDGKSSGIRIHWQMYLEYIKACPAVPESKRVPSRKRAI